MVFDNRKIFRIRLKKKFFGFKIKLFRERVKVSLKEICIINEIWKKISRIRKLDLNMIWDHDRYVKASPGSDDFGRKSGEMWESCQFCSLSWKWSFFSKIENRFLGVKNQKPLLWDESPCLECISKPLVWLEKIKKKKINKNKKYLLHTLKCTTVMAFFFQIWHLRVLICKILVAFFSQIWHLLKGVNLQKFGGVIFSNLTLKS